MSQQPRSLVMLITGGSRGIGAATARLAAAAGYDVCVNYANNAAAAEAVVADCVTAGSKAIAVQADVVDEAAVVAMFDRTESELGPISVVVNNAGIVSKIEKFENYSAERIREVFDINVVGAMLVARESVRRMATDLGGIGGSIVNVSSAAAYTGGPGEFIDYAATKGAIDSLTIGMSKEFGTRGVRVNAVRPGLIETEIHASAGAPDRVARFAPNIPMGRGGSAEEVAETILWLGSDAASYVTGAFLNVSGGR